MWGCGTRTTDPRRWLTREEMGVDHLGLVPDSGFSLFSCHWMNEAEPLPATGIRWVHRLT